jgi:hypothetical protein
MRKCALRPHEPSRGLDPISAMSWGVEPVRRDRQGKSIIRMRGVYAAHPQIARTFVRSTADWQSPEFGSVAAVNAPPSRLFPRNFATILFLLSGLTLLEQFNLNANNLHI